MKTLTTCGTLIEALQLRSVLEAAGIESEIPDEVTAQIAPHHVFSPGIRLQVDDEDFDQARSILMERAETQNH